MHKVNNHKGSQRMTSGRLLFQGALICLLSASSFLKPVLAQELVKIAHVAPLSGAQALYGQDNENGVRMAIEELNTQQRVIAGKRIRFELLTEDDRASPKQATLIARKLCAAQVAGVVGHLNSEATLAAAKVYAHCGIPHITAAATSPQLTQLGYPTTFRIIANDNQLGIGLANYAADILKLKTVAVLDDRTAYGHGLAEVFKRTALQRGLKIVIRGSSDNATTDFKPILIRIEASAVDALFFGGMYPQAAAMLRQMEQLGMRQMYYLGGDGLCTDTLATLAGQASTLDKVVCATGGAVLDKRPLGRAWHQRYEQRFPGQFQFYSPYTYDATYVLADAMRRANSTDPNVFTSFLPSTGLHGVSADIRFESNGELQRPAITLFTFKQGKRMALN